MVDKIWYNMEELIGGSEERVLIETYWNVKHHWTFYPPCLASRINRNILECKDSKTGDETRCIKVLIETYWNVKKDISSYYKDGSLWSINRNILECKEKSMPGG